MKNNIFKLTVLGMMLALFLSAIPTPQTLAANKGEKVRLLGTVTAIDLKGQNFSVSDRNNNVTTIFVNPGTEFEIEKGKGFWGDDAIPFKDLKVGDWVKVKSYRVNGELEADDVEIYRE